MFILLALGTYVFTWHPPAERGATRHTWGRGLTWVNTLCFLWQTEAAVENIIFHEKKIITKQLRKILVSVVIAKTHRRVALTSSVSDITAEEEQEQEEEEEQEEEQVSGLES